MTYSEYNNLQKGDVVYYVELCYPKKMTIEPVRVAEIITIPSRTVWIAREGSDLTFLLEYFNFDLCFLNLDEASKRLEELINNQEHKRRKNYDLAPKKSKQKYVYALTTITI